MKLYKTTITPTSNFATPLQGDTIFGQICWAIRLKYSEDRLNELLKDYEEEPFLVVSDGFANGFLPKPTMPSFLLGEDNNKKKENRKRVWLSFNDLIDAKFTNAKTDKEANNNDKNINLVRNSINYKTFTTDEKSFAPYGVDEFCLSKKDIYFLLNDNFELKELRESLLLLSQMGYGKDTTVGKGRFEFSEIEQIEIDTTSNAFMTLSPANLYNIEAKELFYEPFTKFGKHGQLLANKNPFKKPLLLAKSGAVVIYDNPKSLSFIGSAIKGHSAHKNSVHQGYSISLPIRGLKL